MKDVPKALRLQIGLFGRTNVGKSSFLNLAAGQEVAITSPLPGTTTDVVEKTMELLPVGPVVFLDTAGLDDVSALAEARLKKTRNIFDRTDVILLVLEPNKWTGYEDGVVAEARERKIPLIGVVNKIDLEKPSEDFLRRLRDRIDKVIACSSLDKKQRDLYVDELKKHLLEVVPDDRLTTRALIGDLIPAGGLAVLIVPIDLEAPKGRIILPQVQAIRDVLDHKAAAVVVKESEYPDLLAKLKGPPDLVVCDSQVVDKMVAETPAGVKCTTFSILMARFKGDLAEAVRGVQAIDRLKTGDKVLIAEACSHHPLADDIGRVKIPKWLKEKTGRELKIDVCAGQDFPEDLKEHKLVIHCGGCMINRRQMLTRTRKARAAGVPITNYGLAISYLRGRLDRVLEPFPEAAAALPEAG